MNRSERQGAIRRLVREQAISTQSELAGALHAAGHDDASRRTDFVVDAGEPSILMGTDTGASPAEHLLHALAASLTTSIVYVAATRGVHLSEVESSLEADLDVRGALGLTGADRRGFRRIRISLRVGGDAPERELRGIVALARRRSAVLDLVMNGVRVDVVVTYLGADGTMIDAAVAAGARGIVSAGTGAGRPTPAEEAALDRANSAGVIICQGTRVGSGRTVRSPGLRRKGWIASDNLQPWKARILLRQLELPYERVTVDLFTGETRTTEHFARNPDGRVPVLELDTGETIAESSHPRAARRDRAADALLPAARRRAHGPVALDELPHAVPVQG